jgi:EpsI family protein
MAPTGNDGEGVQAVKMISARVLLVALSMLVASGLAVAMKPTERIADRQARIDLETAIPLEFADWKVDRSIVPVQVSADVQARLDKIYSQTLARTYVNEKGERIMLSIAYGGDQSGEATQVHRPEFCYGSQGFQILRSELSAIATRFGDLQARRLVAVQGHRNEPITYWITVGEDQTLPGIGRKLSQLKYGLVGEVPDGMLVRVSSISADRVIAYQIQDKFVEQLLGAVNADTRVRLAGRFES